MLRSFQKLRTFLVVNGNIYNRTHKRIINAVKRRKIEKNIDDLKEQKLSVLSQSKRREVY